MSSISDVALGLPIFTGVQNALGATGLDTNSSVHDPLFSDALIDEVLAKGSAFVGAMDLARRGKLFASLEDARREVAHQLRFATPDASMIDALSRSSRKHAFANLPAGILDRNGSGLAVMHAEGAPPSADEKLPFKAEHEMQVIINDGKASSYVAPYSFDVLIRSLGRELVMVLDSLGSEEKGEVNVVVNFPTGARLQIQSQSHHTNRGKTKPVQLYVSVYFPSKDATWEMKRREVFEEFVRENGEVARLFARHGEHLSRQSYEHKVVVTPLRGIWAEIGHMRVAGGDNWLFISLIGELGDLLTHYSEWLRTFLLAHQKLFLFESTP